MTKRLLIIPLLAAALIGAGCQESPNRPAPVAAFEKELADNCKNPGGFCKFRGYKFLIIHTPEYKEVVK